MEKRRTYSTSLKLEAVKTFLKGEKSASIIAVDLGISSRRMVEKWVLIYEKFGEDGFKDKRGKLTGPRKGRPKKDFNSLEEENKFLRAKVALLEALTKREVKKK